MSLLEFESTPGFSDQPLISDELLAEAGGNYQLANRFLIMRDIELELLANPGNEFLLSQQQAMREDVEYYLVAQSLGKVWR